MLRKPVDIAIGRCDKCGKLGVIRMVLGIGLCVDCRRRQHTSQPMTPVPDTKCDCDMTPCAMHLAAGYGRPA